MSTLRVVQLGAGTARRTIATGEESPGDEDAALLRVAVLEFLRAYADRLSADPGTEDLFAAYRGWLTEAVALYSTGAPERIAPYMRAGALLDAELELASARASGLLDDSSRPDRTSST
jgi:hypothetical protein